MNTGSQVWNDATNNNNIRRDVATAGSKQVGVKSVIQEKYFCSLREESKNFSTGIYARTSGLHVVIFSPTNQTSKEEKKKKEIIHERREVKV